MKTILAVFSFILLFASCDTPRYAYSPTAHNIPVLAKQFDSKIGASYSTNGTASQSGDNNNETKYTKNTAQGFDVQGALAVTNNFAVQASYFHRDEKTTATSDYNFDLSHIKYKRNMFEFGAGFFTHLDTKERIFFQAFAGLGLGKTTIDDNGTYNTGTPYSRYYYTDLTKYYLEPSITFRAKEIFTGSIGTRLSVIKFRNIKTNYTFDEKDEFNLDSLNRFAVLFFEPAFVGSFGFKQLPGFRIEFQAGVSVLWEESFIDYRPFNFSLGLIFDIRKLINGPAGKSKD